jgi:hypothetical protein
LANTVLELLMGNGVTFSLDPTEPDTGTYEFKIWDVPAPQTFSIAIGDTVTNGVPGVGATVKRSSACP